MCGIFGYYNYNVGQDLRGILDVLFRGLRRLEYRGYDSSGVCVDIVEGGGVGGGAGAGAENGGANGGKLTFLSSGGGTPADSADAHPLPRRRASSAAALGTSGRAVVLKAEGKIDNLQQIAEAYLSEKRVDDKQRHPTHVGISHTRWATHGPPSAVNAHPHASDKACEFVVVHNGIITNYAALRAWLTKRGETFVSETDTEVIPKLCRYVYASLVAEAQRASSTGGGSAAGGDALASSSEEEDGEGGDGSAAPFSRPPSGPEVVPFPRLVMEVLKRLEGAYAILVRSSHYPGELVACKRGSPLILGVKEEAAAEEGGGGGGLLPAAAGAAGQGQGHGQAHLHMASGPRAEAGAGVSKTAGTHSAAAAAPVPAAAVAKAATTMTTPSCAAAAAAAAPSSSLLPPARAAGRGNGVGGAPQHTNNTSLLLNRSGSFARVADSYNRATWAPHLELWVASDASAVVEHTRRVIVLEDGDVLHVCGGGWGIYNLGAADIDAAVPRALQTLQVEVDQIMKGGYDHFMLKEIHEQPDAIVQTMRGRVLMGGRGEGKRREDDEGKEGAGAENGAKDASSSGALPRTTTTTMTTTTPTTSGRDPYPPHPPPTYAGPRIKLGGLVETADVMRRSRRIMFVACGTSYHSCLAARSTVEEMTDAPVVLELASDLLDREGPIFRDDTCVFVSQSGETADTLRALEYAKSRGALCVGVTNTVGSAISRATHCGVHQNAGYEIGVASTKAYTSQIVCVTMMALALAEDSISKRGRRDEIISALAELPDKIRKALLLDGQMRELAQQLNEQQSNSLLFFARGANYATALEAALKMKEVALIHSEGILAGEMKHGPLALVDETLPVVVVATRDAMYAKMQSVIQQLLARGARLIVLCNEGDEALRALARERGAAAAAASGGGGAAGAAAPAASLRLIEVPLTADALQPVVNIVPLQLLAYHLTLLRGFNVDQPRNLAKSVTVAD